MFPSSLISSKSSFTIIFSPTISLPFSPSLHGGSLHPPTPPLPTIPLIFPNCNSMDVSSPLIRFPPLPPFNDAVASIFIIPPLIFMAGPPSPHFPLLYSPMHFPPFPALFSLLILFIFSPSSPIAFNLI